MAELREKSVKINKKTKISPNKKNIQTFYALPQVKKIPKGNFFVLSVQTLSISATILKYKCN